MKIDIILNDTSKRTLKGNHRYLNPFAENFCESLDIRTKVGEFRNKDAISLERLVSNVLDDI